MTLQELCVLLVEPSKAQAHIAQNFLLNLGVSHVTWAQSGLPALESMRQDPPDLVISAMHLPDITGTELVQQMRSDEGLAEIAFLLVSSETHYRYLEPIRQAGAIAILPKPYSETNLKKALLSTVDLLSPLQGNLIAGREPEDLHVLLVDDSSTARRYIKSILTGLGIEHFMEANNGKEAIACINEHFFDLVVTDYNMPEVDGEGLIRYIRTESSQPGVPILMVSSEQNETKLAGVQQAGVSGICNKVFEPNYVRTLLERIMVE